MILLFIGTVNSNNLNIERVNMENIKKLLCETLNIDFIQAILSNPRTKEGIIKVKVRPVMMKDRLFLQLESFSKTQAFHENLEPDAAVERIVDYMKEFKQMQMATKDTDYTILVSKKGKVTIQKKAEKQAGTSKYRHIIEAKNIFYRKV